MGFVEFLFIDILHCSCQPIITGGYLPSSVYKTRTQYRSTTYPTIPVFSLNLNCRSTEKVMVRHGSPLPSSRLPTTNGADSIQRGPTTFKSSILSPKLVPTSLAISTNNGTEAETDLDVTITCNNGDVTLDNSIVSDSYSTDTLKSPFATPGPKLVELVSIVRPSVSMASSPMSPETSSTIPEFGYRTGQMFSKVQTKAMSHLSIYLSGNSPSTSKSSIDLSLHQTNTTGGSDVGNRINLSATLSNPTSLSSHTIQPDATRPAPAFVRSSLDGQSGSQISLLIKTQRRKKSMSEDNFYDIKSKQVIRCDSGDDLQSPINKDEVTTKLAISPPTASLKVMTSPKVPINSPLHLPEPQYIPHLKSNGKQFFNYPLPEVILCQSPLSPRREQQFSYLERVKKLRLGGTVSPVDHRGATAITY